MNEEPNPYQRRRESFLTIFLTLLGSAGILLYLIAVTGGFFLYVILAVLVIASVGFFHYLLWGRMMSESVAGEREELEQRERAEAADWPLPDAGHPRHQ
jgi:hypothetical protein